MPVVLLLLGLATVVAGLLLAEPGLVIRDGAFDIAAITPAVVAVVGGFVLVGLGLAVRVLQRIEQALAVRPAPSTADVGETPAATKEPDAVVRVPFPPKLKSNPRSVPAASVDPGMTEDAAPERLRVKFPHSTKVEDGAAVEGADMSLLPQPAVQREEEVGELKSSVLKSSVIVSGRGNGASPSRVAPRFDLKPRVMVAPDNRAKGSVFKSVAEVRQAAEAAAARVAAPSPAVEPPAANETAAEPAAPSEQSPSVLVLKSGVVEGMAYTLYSDGSIEAQLPHGTLRFGSITALREHIEGAS